MVRFEQTLNDRSTVTPSRQFHIDLPRGAHLHIEQMDAAETARELRSPLELDDGLLLHIHRSPCRLRIVGDDGSGRHAEVSAGDITCYAVRMRSPIQYIGTAEYVALHVSSSAFAAVSDEIGATFTGSFKETGTPFEDICIQALTQSLLSGLASETENNRTFLLHSALALVIHIGTRAGAFAPHGAISRGGLAPWQVRCAQEMFSRDISDTVSLAEVAEACGLSASHFSRAFRCSVGTPPHAWLLRNRVETAKALMRRAALPLSEIALNCGFADQSHFTRVFTREVGKSPGKWRGALLQTGAI